MTARASIVEAGEAVRAAQGRMVAAGQRWTPSDWAVFSAVVALVGSWSRVEDHVSRPQVAEAAGVTERQVSRSMGRLSEAGVLGWEPGRNGRSSLVSLCPQRDSSGPAGSDGQRDSTCPATSVASGTAPVPLAEGVAGQDPAPSGTGSATQRDHCGPSPEKTPEKNPEEREGRTRTDVLNGIVDPTAPCPFGEFVERLLRFVDREGGDRADQALAHLEVAGRRLGWPRDLSRALDRWAADNPPPAEPEPAPVAPAKRTVSEWCRDHGADPHDELISELLTQLIDRGQVLPDPMAVAS